MVSYEWCQIRKVSFNGIIWSFYYEIEYQCSHLVDDDE